MKIGEAIAYRINKICNEKDLSVNKLASICCITQSTIQHIMDGQNKNPKSLTILRICDGLGMKLKEFYDDPIFDNLDRED